MTWFWDHANRLKMSTALSLNGAKQEEGVRSSMVGAKRLKSSTALSLTGAKKRDVVR